MRFVIRGIMTDQRGMNPFRVMIDPRGFMRGLTASMQKRRWILAWVMGTTLLFGRAYAFSLGLNYSLLQIVLASIVLGIPVGYLVIYIFSIFLYWTGKIFRGRATFSHVVDAYFWTRIIEVFPLISWIGLMVLFGRFAFTQQVVQDQTMSFFVIGLIGMQGAFHLWGVIILLHTLGQVQGLSAWIMIWNVLFASVLLLVVEGTINWFFSNAVGIGSFSAIGSVVYG